MTNLQAYIDEYVREVVGSLIYDAIMDTVRSVIYGHGYPRSYSPNGRWDPDAETALAHEWLDQKLLRLNLLEHFLDSNDSERGLKKGLELSFIDFLVGQRKRTALDNLFGRAHALLTGDLRFELLVQSRRKGVQVWGLRGWVSPAQFNRSEKELINAGFRVRAVPIIRYREDALKLSPVLSESDLGDFIAMVLAEVGAALSLNELTTVLAYRFDLLPGRDVSLDEPDNGNAEEGGIAPIDFLAAPGTVEDSVILDETVQQILRALSTRQQRVLLEYAQGDQSLASVAAIIGCAKGTVDNELQRAMHIIHQHTDSEEEAGAAHVRLVAVLAGAE